MIWPWNATQGQACEHISTLLGIPRDTLRNWVRDPTDRPSFSSGHKQGSGESPEQELAGLRKENKELKRANAILKSASAFLLLSRATRYPGVITSRGRPASVFHGSMPQPTSLMCGSHAVFGYMVGVVRVVGRGYLALPVLECVANQL